METASPSLAAQSAPQEGGIGKDIAAEQSISREKSDADISICEALQALKDRIIERDIKEANKVRDIKTTGSTGFTCHESWLAQSSDVGEYEAVKAY